ncbi:foldase protein PrsA precursor [bacterium BMS3Abin15]|nr:foldase protein PrsA precursor [bacterium BMS3Abin15]HDZ85915.1 protein translocase subunit SecD [Candidatus Moranbacteria bacterium]
MSLQRKIRIKFILIILLALFVGLVSYPQAVSFYPPVYNALNQLKVNLGLDLQGGMRLEYKAILDNVEKDKIGEAMSGVQDVIERRINAFGVGEPLIQTAISGGEHRITVELPGIKDMEDAKKKIKETPFLEFKEENTEEEMKEMEKLLDPANKYAMEQAQEILEKVKSGENFEDLAKENSQDPGSAENGGDLGFVKRGNFVPEFDKVLFEGNLSNEEIYPELLETQFGWHIIKKIEERGEGDDKEIHSKHILIMKKTIDMFPDLKYKSSGLSGKNLKTADVVFANQGLSEPQVSLKFDDEGTKVFAELTKNNIGKTIAIYLDETIISAPVVQVEITNGEAVITGDFSVDEAKKLSQRLNEGALPVPLTLVSQQSIEASLGKVSLDKSLVAGAAGLAAVMVFMIIYYRFLGFIAAIALLIYTGLMISIFKLSGFISPWPITLTLSGIAGFILSLGMVVDANILIFERTKEELRSGRNVYGAIEEGFRRAWPSIRDGNVSTIITTLILIFVGTGFVKGFAVVLLIGVLVSMFTAIVLVRNILKFVAGEWLEKRIGLIVKVNKQEIEE